MSIPLLNAALVPAPCRPIAVVQFGEGNFLRAFADQMIEVTNRRGLTDWGVAVVKPIAGGSLDAFHAQDNRYTVLFRGQRDGVAVDESEIITAIRQTVDPYLDFAAFEALAGLPTLEIVLSNTTEAGIVFNENDRLEMRPAQSFPAKLTQFLYKRYTVFQGDDTAGLIILPCELIEKNGHALLSCVLKTVELWQLPEDFARWLHRACVFCSTLVDRTVTGFPKDDADAIFHRLGYEDRLLVAAEPFALWVIETQADLSERFPLQKAGLPVVFTHDLGPARERKVRLLNGGHTGTVLASYLMGIDIVKDLMRDPDARHLLDLLIETEILPTLKLPEGEIRAFALAVIERFENPFIHHRLLDISLNSFSKWRSRCLPTLKDRLHQTGKLPPFLTFSYASLLAFYTCDATHQGTRDGQPYPIRDDKAVLVAARDWSGLPAREYVQRTASVTGFWGEDLAQIPGFVDRATEFLERIQTQGMREAVRSLWGA